MIPWEHIASTVAPDGQRLELKRRGHEYLCMAGGHDLMSSEDEGSSRALADLGCAHIDRDQRALVLVGGLGMGYTLRAALDAVGPRAVVEVSEFVPAVAEWNRGELSGLADAPLDDPRCRLHIGDVRLRIKDAAAESYDAILLDIDNGPVPLAHKQNEAVYGARGLTAAWSALRPGGVLGVWSFSDDHRFTHRLERQGFSTKLHRVTGSRKGRGRYHVIWVARRPVGRKPPRSRPA